jgi:acyl carrier protein phosphodiesterase
MGDVKASADLRASVLAAAERDLDAFTRRYRELTDVLAFVEKAKETLRARRRRSAPVENRASA